MTCACSAPHVVTCILVKHKISVTYYAGMTKRLLNTPTQKLFCHNLLDIAAIQTLSAHLGQKICVKSETMCCKPLALSIIDCTRTFSMHHPFSNGNSRKLLWFCLLAWQSPLLKIAWHGAVYLVAFDNPIKHPTRMFPIRLQDYTF